MKISYKLTSEDFLEFNLYTASKSELTQKKQKRGMILLFFIIGIMAVYLVADKQYETLIYPAILVVIVIFFYKKYFRWRMKKGYQKYIKSVHADQLNKEESIEIKQKSIAVDNQSGKGSIALSDVVQLNETTHLFMFLLQSGTSIVIPKRELKSEDEFIGLIQKLNIKRNEELDWKW